MAYLYRRLLLYVQRALKIPIFRHLPPRSLGVPEPRRNTLMRPELRLNFHLTPNFPLSSGPLIFKSMPLHLPLRPLPGFDNPIEVGLRIDSPRKTSIDIGLLHLLKRRGRVHVERAVAVGAAVVVGLGAGHPIGCVFAVFAG